MRLVPKAEAIAAICYPELLNRILVEAFGKRRKTLRNSLKELADAQTLEENGIDPSARAEVIPVEAYVAFANSLGDQQLNEA